VLKSSRNSRCAQCMDLAVGVSLAPRLENCDVAGRGCVMPQSANWLQVDSADCSSIWRQHFDSLRRPSCDPPGELNYGFSSIM